MAIGVDGCRGGWAVARDDGLLAVVATFPDVLALDHGAVAVDMPVGLLESGMRWCDRECRRRLGNRRSSIFPAPHRPALAAGSFDEVTGLSIQAWHLVPKVREVDDCWEPRVVEVSPELSFATMAGKPMRHGKRAAAGRVERLAALGVAEVPRLRGARSDDVLDALACLWTARRVENGTALVLTDGTVDARGRPLATYA